MGVFSNSLYGAGISVIENQREYEKGKQQTKIPCE